MFDAVEWLSSVTQAARLADAESRWMDAQRIMATRLGSPMKGIHTGVSDPMKPIDAMIDSEPSHRKALQSALAELADARAVFSGMRQIGAMENMAASMMELVHIGLLSKKDAAGTLGISYDKGKRAYLFGVDWLDAHGTARAKDGKGLAQDVRQ